MPTELVIAFSCLKFSILARCNLNVFKSDQL